MNAIDKATLQILRRKQVEYLTQLSRSTLYAEIKAGRFPKQVHLTSKRSVGWVESEIHAYLQARIDESRKLVNGGIPNRTLPKRITPCIAEPINRVNGGA